MIVEIESRSGPSSIQELSTSKSEAFSLSFQEAISDNPSVKFYEWWQARNATGRDLSKEEAESKIKDSGVEVKIPLDEGIKEDALDLLITRQQEKRARREALSRAEQGWTLNAIEFTGGLAGSFLDPVNIAASFIPIPFLRQAGAAALIGRGFLGRGAVRAGVGAVEGTVGTGAIETVSYPLSQELGDDYDHTNVLMNMVYGGSMGAILHPVTGALLDRFHPDTRKQLAQVSMAQALEDRPINVDPVVYEDKLKKQKELSQVNEWLDFLNEEQNPKEVSFLKVQKERLLNELKEGTPHQGKETTPLFTDEELKQKIDQAKQAQPDSTYLEPQLMEEQAKTLKDPHPVDMTLEEAQSMLNQELQTLKELADSSGLETESLLKEADNQLKKSKEISKARKLLSLCLLRKGGDK